jgi:alkanesulfonate monooxygenase SsuD/methylene tetrahydromethanopterin reductase-like flavin-dependent oxidoreductase (luciferase family)
VISGGRAIFGVGAAWNDVEHEGYGFDFPPIRERLDRLEEALTIAKAMFTEDRPTFRGKHYRLETALNEPKPVHPAGPPILVGGGGEQRTLRIAAHYADMTHWFPLGMETLKRKTDLLVRYCEEIGRDPATVERTMATPVIVAASVEAAEAALERIPPERRPFVAIGTPDRAAEALQPYIDAGFTGFTFNNTIYRTPEDIARVGELLELVGGGTLAVR